MAELWPLWACKGCVVAHRGLHFTPQGLHCGSHCSDGDCIAAHKVLHSPHGSWTGAHIGFMGLYSISLRAAFCPTGVGLWLTLVPQTLHCSPHGLRFSPLGFDYGPHWSKLGLHCNPQACIFASRDWLWLTLGSQELHCSPQEMAFYSTGTWTVVHIEPMGLYCNP